MGFQNVFKKFGAWTTVMKWHEPWMYRVRLKGDWLARFAWAFAMGSVPTTLLLGLFAVNVKPPHPGFAFIGMLLIGGLFFMFLVNGRKLAGGRVRLCEEGIIRRRMYAGASSQWIEDWSWPYSEIPQCAIIQGESIGKSFNVLMITDGSTVELIGIPERISLEQVAQVLSSRGVVVRYDVGLPPESLRPIHLPIPIVASAMGLFLLFGGLVFYAVNTTGRHGRDVAVRNRDAIPENPADLPPKNALEPLPVAPPPEPAPVTEPEPTSEQPTPPQETPASVIPDIPAPVDAPTIPSVSPATNPTTSDPLAPAPVDPQPEPAGLRRKGPASSISPFIITEKTDLLGGTGGSEFERISPNQAPIIGFRYRMGSWGGKPAVAIWESISDSTSTRRDESLVLARQGFVVGGIQVDADDLVRAIRVVFVKLADDGSLDKTDYYFSDWIGQTTGGPVKTLGKGNVPVIGVYGRRGLVVDAIGLVLGEPKP